MQYEVEVQGRVRQVAVHRAGGAFDVSVDGRTWRVDAARIDARSMSLLVEPGASYDVGFAPDPATGLLYVRVGTTQVAVALNGRRRRHDDAEHAGSGPQRIAAPMPGKIVRVGVKPGDVVHARQTVVVIEAMKMENLVYSPCAGTIKEIRVKVGDKVGDDDIMVVIE